MKLEKFVWTGIAALVAMCIGTAPISAKPGAPKPATAKATAVKPSSPKPVTTKTTMTTSHGMKPVSTTPKVKATSTPKVKATSTPKVKATSTPKVKTTTGVSTTKSAKAAKTTTTTTTTTTTANTTTTTGGTAGTTTTAPLSKAQQKLATNSKLATKMTERMGTALPANVTIVQAASGFKNLGQFIAAVNVSNNLQIPFAELKSRMTGLTVDGQPAAMTGGTTGGTTTPTLMSLGQAIQDYKGTDTTTATQAANTATTQANQLIASTTTTTTTTTSTTTTTTKSKTAKKH
jgi:hypothetical protein